MTNNEVNKVISEYMGGPYIGDACQDDIYGVAQCTEKFICEACDPILEHYLSLDALVPVWHKAKLCLQYISKEGERLEDLDNYYIPINGKYRAWVTEIGYYENYWSDKDTIQEAAAHATAKAILALGEKWKG